MRFRVFPAERMTDELVGQAYLSGIDRTSWPVRSSVEGGELILQRSVSDSGNLHAPWPVEGHGPLTLTTAFPSVCGPSTALEERLPKEVLELFGYRTRLKDFS